MTVSGSLKYFFAFVEDRDFVVLEMDIASVIAENADGDEGMMLQIREDVRRPRLRRKFWDVQVTDMS